MRIENNTRLTDKVAEEIIKALPKQKKTLKKEGRDYSGLFEVGDVLFYVQEEENLFILQELK